MLVLARLAACGPSTQDTDAPDPHGLPGVLEITAGPTVTRPGPTVSLAWWFDITTDEPTTLVLTVDGPEQTRDVAFPTVQTHHHVPVLALRPDTTYTVTAHLENAGGDTVDATPVSLDSGPLPVGLPTVDVAVSIPDRIEPGLTLMIVNDDLGWIVAIDAEGFPVYVQQATGESSSLAAMPNGDLAMLDGTAVTVHSVMGTLVKRWTSTPEAPEDIAVDYPDFHHELLPQPDGSFFALSYRTADVDAYPTGYELPFTFAPATIRNDLVIHVAADGTTLDEFAMLDVLDPRRIGYNSLQLDKSGILDWVHANALQYDADTDELTVSLRHQDAVLRFSRATGAPKWIFGHPFGWPPALEELLLTPTTDLVWPTHQHGVQVTPDGRIRMFDNGNNNRSTPWYDSGQGVPYSRIFEATIDEAAGTVTPVADYHETTLGLLYAGAFGNADLLPGGNRLGTWGSTDGGTGPARIVEFAADGTVVFEFAIDPPNWNVDRAVRVPSLYPADVTVLAR